MESGEWTVPAPEFTAPQPAVTDWSEGVQVLFVPLQEIFTEDSTECPAVPSPPRGLVSSPTYGPLSGHELFFTHESKGKDDGGKESF